MTDRSSPPPLTAPRRASVPPILRARLRNGLRILAVETHEVPLVSLELGCEAGAEHDAAALAGRATLTAALLDEGTARRSSSEIAATIESLGGHLSTVAGWEAATVRLGVLTPSLEPAFELAAEILRSPTFPPEEFERLRRQRQAELLHRRTQPAALAEERLARVLYGDGPYGRPLSGDEASTATLTRDDAVDFFRQRAGPSRGWLLAAGAVRFADLVARAEQALGDWAGVAAGERPDVSVLQRDAVTVDIIDRPGSAQTELRLGHAGIGKLHPDRVPLAVANALLGGKFTSRINLNLRERRGLTYGAFSRLADRRGPGPFTVGAAVATERTGEAVRETLGEIERLRQEAPAAQELADTQSYLVGVFPYQLQTGDDLVHKLEELALYDLPDDFYDRRLREIEAVTPEDVLRAARAHLLPEGLAIVAAGPAAELIAQLEPFGELRVITPGSPTAPLPS
jgi:zinc protease